MLKMSQVNYIRDLSNSGYRIAEISKKLKLDRKTVRKYLSQEDFSPTPPVKHPAPSKLDPYKSKILEWLAEDRHVWQKQQHTAKRILDRLREEEGFDGSQMLFRIVSDSYERKSLILTTNLEFSKWGSVFTDEQMAAAMIDRLAHHGHLLMAGGRSYRMEHALMRQDAVVEHAS